MKNTVKKEKLAIRINSNEKKKLLSSAKRVNLNLSSYVRMKLFSPVNKGKSEESNLKIGRITVEAQEILNYIQDKYENDDKLERMVENLWKHI